MSLPTFLRTNVCNACIRILGWGLGRRGSGMVHGWPHLQLTRTSSMHDTVQYHRLMRSVAEPQWVWYHTASSNVHWTLSRSKSQRLRINQPWRKERTANHQITCSHRVVCKWKWRSFDTPYKQYIVLSVKHAHTRYCRILKTFQWHEKARQQIRGTLSVLYGNTCRCANNYSSNQPRQGLQEHTTALTQHDHALKCLINCVLCVYYDGQSSLGTRPRPGTYLLRKHWEIHYQCPLWHPPPPPHPPTQCCDTCWVSKYMHTLVNKWHTQT